MWLKQSTAATVKMGPFVDDTDGKTPETGLSIGQADIRISKNGGNFAQTNNSAGATHDENGYYDVSLDETDTNTLGRLRVAISVSGALPVWRDFIVLPANVYDSLVGGSDYLKVDAVEISSSSTAADNVEANIANLDTAVSEVLTAVYNIGVAAASVAEVASGRVITTGTEGGDYEDTYGLDEVYHTTTASGGVIDYYYEFTLDDDSVPVDLHVKGRLHEGSSPSGQDSVDIEVYDWNASAWESVVPPLGGFVGVTGSDSSDDEVRVAPLFARHKDSSTNKVRVRFNGTSLKTGTALYIDQIYITYTSVLSYTGIAGAILENSNYKLKTDSDGYALADAVKISGSAAAADNVEANIGNLDAAVSDVKSQTDKLSFDASNRVVADARAISASTTAADNVEANIGNLDAAISDVKSQTDKLTFDGSNRIVADARAISASTTAADNVEANIGNLDAAVSDVKAKTDNLNFTDTDVKATLDGEKVTVSSNEDKTGYKLASDGLDSVSTTAPTGVASNFREMIVQLWRRFFKKATLTSTELKTYADDGTTPITTQSVSDDGTTQTQGAAS